MSVSEALRLVSEFGHYPSVREAFGLRAKGSTWPKYLEGEAIVSGVTFQLFPSDARGRTSQHRLYVMCPVCSRAIPAGKFRQHVGYKHPEHRS